MENVSCYFAPSGDHFKGLSDKIHRFRIQQKPTQPRCTSTRMEKNASLLNRVTQGMDRMCKRQSVPFGVTHLKADCFEEAHKFIKSHSGKDMACRKNCG